MNQLSRICPIDVTGLQRKLACVPSELWNKRTQRKIYHPNTRYIAILWPTPDKGKNEWTEESEFFLEELTPIFKIVDFHYKSVISRVLLTMLTPGGTIAPHKDVDPADLSCHRLHLPIVTDPKVFFILDGHHHVLDEGILYELDIQSEHSVENHWEFSRIHLVMDVLRKS